MKGSLNLCEVSYAVLSFSYLREATQHMKASYILNFRAYLLSKVQRLSLECVKVTRATRLHLDPKRGLERPKRHVPSNSLYISTGHNPLTSYESLSLHAQHHELPHKGVCTHLSLSTAYYYTSPVRFLTLE